MAVIRDIYELTTKSDVSELQAVAAVIGRNAASIRAMAAAAGQATAQFLRLRPTISGTLLAARNLGAVGVGAFRGLIAGAGRLGMVIRGLLPGIGILAGLLGGLAFGAVRAIGSMRDRLAESEDTARGASGAVSRAGDAATETAAAVDDMARSARNTERAATGAGRAIQQTAKVAKEAAAQVNVTLGAMGDVGAGFVQRQGKVTSTVGKQAKDAADSAESAADAADAAAEAADAAAEAYEAAAGAGDMATQSTDRFVRAVDRIGAAWGRAMDTIMRAIAVALTPALEAVADLMESPVFQEFMRLVAEDLGRAFSELGQWIITTAIPAVMGFMDEVNKAGGPIAWVGQKFEGLKTTALQALAIILFYVEEFGVWVREKINWLIEDSKTGFSGLREFIGVEFEKIRQWITIKIQEAGEAIKRATDAARVYAVERFEMLRAAAVQKFGEVVTAAQTKFDEVKAAIKARIDGAVSAARIALGTLWDGVVTAAVTAWDGVSAAIAGALVTIVAGIRTALTSQETLWGPIAAAVKTAFSGIVDTVGKAFTGIANVIIGVYNRIVEPLNVAIRALNALRAAVGEPAIGEIGTVKPLARGGIVTDTMLALVGDNPSRREAVIPLDDPAARDMLGGMGSGLVIQNLTVALAPGGYGSAQAAGIATADAIYNALRARGKRIP